VIGAVDIGGTKIAAGIVDDRGKVLSRVECPTDAARVYSSGLAQMIRLLRESAQIAGIELSGIGIGSTGWVYPFTGEFGDVDFLPEWKGCNPVKDLAREFNVFVALENDGDAAALGEATWGAGKDKSRLIYVTVGTGIGGGIILDGELYRGVDRSHPEVDITSWMPRGRFAPAASGDAGKRWQQARRWRHGSRARRRPTAKPRKVQAPNKFSSLRKKAMRWLRRPSRARRITSGWVWPT
jgi:glucokinase